MLLTFRRIHHAHFYLNILKGFCGIAYAVCSTVPAASAFAISGTSAGVAATTTALTDTSWNTDWLLIPCATDQMNSAVLSTSTTTTFVGCVAKICGVIFSSTTTATTAATVYCKYSH